jgi:hypothetical protein
MSKMSQLYMDIVDLLGQDFTASEIADLINVDIDIVYDVMDTEEGNTFDDSMDGDFDSAMASAGFGTDEDYGYYGDE